MLRPDKNAAFALILPVYILATENLANLRSWYVLGQTFHQKLVKPAILLTYGVAKGSRKAAVPGTAKGGWANRFDSCRAQVIQEHKGESLRDFRPRHGV